MVRSTMGIALPSRGEIIFKGMGITDLPTYKIARSGIGFVPQRWFIFPSLNVNENLRVATRNNLRVGSYKGRWTNLSTEDSVIKAREVAPSSEAKRFSKENPENLK